MQKETTLLTSIAVIAFGIMMTDAAVAQPGGGGRRGGGRFDPATILEQFDENKDKKLSKSELPERMQQMMSRADADEDGFLTEDELKKMVAQRGQRGETGGREGRGGPGGGREGRGGPGGGRGGRGGPGGGPGEFMKTMIMRMPIIAALDADKDGEISTEEIENAVAALKTLDKNKDGKIVAEELIPERGPGGPGGDFGGRRGRGGFGGGPGGRGGDRPQRPSRPE